MKDYPLPEIVTPALIDHIRQSYWLNWNGLHGWNHWVRVCQNGLYLAQRNGANQRVVALFAFTHDMDRRNDGFDPGHGPRAARRIKAELQGIYFELLPEELILLTQAISDHTNGKTQADITVQTCWDADRLDIGRAGIIPHPSRLCTPQAKDPDTLKWAYNRSIGRDGREP